MKSPAKSPSKKSSKSKIQKNIPALKSYALPDIFGNWLGYSVKTFDVEKQCATTEITLRDDHLSSAGRIHGGVVAAFLDFSCGAAVFTTLLEAEFCSTVELKVNYLQPLFTGDQLQSFSEIVFRGKRLAVVRATVYKNGMKKNPVAIATGTFNIVHIPK